MIINPQHLNKNMFIHLELDGLGSTTYIQFHPYTTATSISGVAGYMANISVHNSSSSSSSSNSRSSTSSNSNSSNIN